jgi:hypothetical protein
MALFVEWGLQEILILIFCLRFLVSCVDSVGGFVH